MPAQVRILHRALDTVGGAEILLVEQAKALAAAGADVEISTLLHDESRWAERLGELRVRALHRSVPGKRPPRVRRALERRQIEWLLEGIADADLSLAHGYPLSSALGGASARGLRAWYCHEAPRWLHPVETNPYLAAHAARAPERHAPQYYRRSFASPLGALPVLGRRRPSRVAADVAGVERLSFVWANSEYTRDSIRRIYGSVRTEVVYPFVHFPERRPERRGNAGAGLRVVSVTRLEWVKNLDTLIEGFALYRKRRDARASLDLVGTGPARSALERIARELGVASAVTFHGFLSDRKLDELSASCDAFACLPLDEPFGMIFPEAIGRGLLVLGPDHGGPVEILEQGKLGELADPLDPEAIADGLARIASLSDAAANERRAAADRACRARFSESAGAERLRVLLAREGIVLAG